MAIRTRDQPKTPRFNSLHIGPDVQLEKRRPSRIGWRPKRSPGNRGGTSFSFYPEDSGYVVGRNFIINRKWQVSVRPSSELYRCSSPFARDWRIFCSCRRAFGRHTCRYAVAAISACIDFGSVCPTVGQGAGT